ncbi:peptide/nickel transport system permease protein [Streptosporangium becharense]|uniref:Peptide/nickel transport system permease protein n=1 Tax=Streptosporangium becharense TaxID=1816182 RepID=A0A7W9ICZ4_9ACTN|nr:ABC transporter permease [Streptosporangium becharense]MBB2912984.1 peptide/nickel transport system permease protein [Streptosporangium becharense]MBB5818191.1 peptide/nickel transport system permease protein [Streptosporangium becharense]
MKPATSSGEHVPGGTESGLPSAPGAPGLLRTVPAEPLGAVPAGPGVPGAPEPLPSPGGAGGGGRPSSGGLGAVVLRLVAWRLAFAVPLLIAVTAGMFALAKASPFDPVRQYLGDRATVTDPEVVERIRANWGLDRPVLEQYATWVGNLFRGDLGDSRSLHLPVTQVIAERLPWTLLATSAAIVLMLAGSLLVGTLAAWREGSWADRLITGGAFANEAAPVFWLGLLAVWVFSVQFGWLPAGGLTSAGSSTVEAGDVAAHMILPVTVLAVSQSSWLVLYVRESVIGTLREDFVVGARARGLRERTVVVRHALRSALLPFLTLLGARVPELVTGAILVETVFSWPGVASASVQAALAVDFPLLAALTLLGTLAVVCGNLLADVAYTVADPRVRTLGVG